MSVGGGQVAVLRLHTASARPRNEGSILLPEENVCASWHKTHQSVKEAPNFGELREREVRRIPLPRRWVNSLVWRFMEKAFAGLPLIVVGVCLDPDASVGLRVG